MNVIGAHADSTSWCTCGQHISTSRRIAFCQWPHEPPLIAIFIHHCAGMAFDGMRLRARRTGMESLTPLRQLGTTAKVFLDPHRATFNSTCTSKLTIQNQFHHCCLQSNVHEHIISSTCYFEQCTANDSEMEFRSTSGFHCVKAHLLKGAGRRKTDLQRSCEASAAIDEEANESTDIRREAASSAAAGAAPGSSHQSPNVTWRCAC